MILVAKDIPMTYGYIHVKVGHVKKDVLLTCTGCQQWKPQGSYGGKFMISNKPGPLALSSRLGAVKFPSRLDRRRDSYLHNFVATQKVTFSMQNSWIRSAGGLQKS